MSARCRLCQRPYSTAPTGEGGPLFCPECGPARPTKQAPARDRNAKHCPAVPGYELLAELGRGGMGVVYHAWDVELKRPVALKMIRSEAALDDEFRARFRGEAEAAARLQHPGIVQIHGVGEADG